MAVVAKFAGMKASEINREAPPKVVRRRLTAEERSLAVVQMNELGSAAGAMAAAAAVTNSPTNHRVSVAEAKGETEKDLTLDISVSSDAPILRAYLDFDKWEVVYYELIKKHTAEAVDFGEAGEAQGAPFFYDHNSGGWFGSLKEDLIARMHNPVLRGGALFVQVRFPKSVANSREAFNKMTSGLAPDVSVGVLIDEDACEWEEAEDDDALDRLICNGWRLYECSNVRIPANQNVGLGAQFSARAEGKTGTLWQKFYNHNAGKQSGGKHEEMAMDKKEKLVILGAAISAVQSQFAERKATPPTAEVLLANAEIAQAETPEQVGKLAGEELNRALAQFAKDEPPADNGDGDGNGNGDEDDGGEKLSATDTILGARESLTATGVSEAAVTDLLAKARSEKWSAEQASAAVAAAKEVATSTARVKVKVGGAEGSGFFASLAEAIIDGTGQVRELSQERERAIVAAGNDRRMPAAFAAKNKIVVPANALIRASLAEQKKRFNQLPKGLEEFAEPDASALYGTGDTDEGALIHRYLARAGVAPLTSVFGRMLSHDIKMPIESGKHGVSYRTAKGNTAQGTVPSYNTFRTMTIGEMVARFELDRLDIGKTETLVQNTMKALNEDFPIALNDFLLNRSAAPKGIIETTGIGEVTPAAIASPTYAEIEEMAAEIGAVNAPMDNLVYVANTKVAKYLRTTQMFSGTNGTPILSGKPSQIYTAGMMAPVMSGGMVADGYPFVTDNNMPTDLVETGNAANNNLTALMLGKWDEICLGYWSDMVLLIDDSSQAVQTSGKISVSLYMQVSWVVKRPNTFVLAKVDIQ